MKNELAVGDVVTLVGAPVGQLYEVVDILPPLSPKRNPGIRRVLIREVDGPDGAFGVGEDVLTKAVEDLAGGPVL